MTVRRRLRPLPVALAPLLVGACALSPDPAKRNLPLEGVAPLRSAGSIEVVVELPRPPGNVAVGPDGRVYFTMHPEARPEGAKLWTLDAAGRPVPFPDEPFQDRLVTPLGLRVDRAGVLWVLDHGDYGDIVPTLIGLDLESREVVTCIGIPSDVAGGGSLLNDLGVDSDRAVAYVADTSPFDFEPAIVVIDIREGTSWRVLVEDRSVESEDHHVVVRGRFLKAYGLPLQLDVDTIALSADGEWLYYGPLTGSRLWRVPTRILREPANEEDRAAAVEDWGRKPTTDGAAIDRAGAVYLTAPELDGVAVLGPDRVLRLLAQDPRLAWPDGLALSPDERWLYVTCSQLHEVLGQDLDELPGKGPFRILRIRLRPD